MKPLCGRFTKLKRENYFINISCRVDISYYAFIVIRELDELVSSIINHIFCILQGT